MSHAVVAVHHCGCWPVLDHFELGFGVQYTVLDPIDVDRLESSNAVGVDAPLVRGDQHVGTDGRLLPRNPDRLESVGHKFFQQIKIYPYKVFRHMRSSTPAGAFS